MYVYGGGYWDQRRGEYTDKFHDLWALNLSAHCFVSTFTCSDSTLATWTWHKPPMNGTLPTALSVFCATARVGHHLIVDGGRDFLNGKEAAYIYDTGSRGSSDNGGCFDLFSFTTLLLVLVFFEVTLSIARCKIISFGILEQDALRGRAIP